MNQLRTNLLSEIISMKGVSQSKYSNCYETIKNIINLEVLENKDFEKSILEKFNNLSKNINNLHPLLKNIPLRIIEEYFIRNHHDLNQYINIIYITEDKKTLECYDLTSGHLYNILEDFFFKILEISILIADKYNIEFKYKKQNEHKVL